MTITTYNFDDMQDTEWLKLVGKPVMIGVYEKRDDSIVSHYVGILGGANLTPTKVKFLVNAESGGWFNPDLAYGLISFEDLD